MPSNSARAARARFAGRSINPFSDANDAISGKEKGKKKKTGKTKRRKPGSSKVNTHGTASGPAGAARRARLRRNADTRKRDAAKARRNKG